MKLPNGIAFLLVSCVGSMSGNPRDDDTGERGDHAEECRDVGDGFPRRRPPSHVDDDVSYAGQNKERDACGERSTHGRSPSRLSPAVSAALIRGSSAGVYYKHIIVLERPPCQGPIG